MPKSQWLNNKQRIEAEQRKEEASLFARWNDANDDAGVLQDALLDAEAEQEAAQVARMAPAATSAAVRAQRERVEAANLEVAWLAAELAKAETQSDELWASYLQYRASVRGGSRTH